MKTTNIIGHAFTRALTVEQINSRSAGQPLRRFAEVGTINQAERTIELAFSSEAPVERWFGAEVLDHGKGAVRGDRLDNGAALLWQHDPHIQIGVVTSWRVDKDRVARAVVRFGRSARAEEIWQDVIDGIIRHVSVGYNVLDIAEPVQRDGELDLVRVTSWEPFEISLVSIPADPSVGVGRSAESAGEVPEDRDKVARNDRDTTEKRQNHSECDVKTKTMKNARGDLVLAEVDDRGNFVREIEVLRSAEDLRADAQGDIDAERERAREINAIGREYGAQDLAADAVNDGTSVADFTRQMLAHVGGGSQTRSQGNEQRGRTVPARARAGNSNGTEGRSQALDDNAGFIGLTDEEARGFSFMRAINALANPGDTVARENAAFEFEASRAAAQSMNRTARGIIVPLDVMTRAFNLGTSGATTEDTGGHLVPNTLLSGSFIQQLRTRSVFARLARPLNGLVGNYSIPGGDSEGEGYWLDEDEEAGEIMTGARSVELSPKAVGAHTEATRDSLNQTSIDVEMLMRENLMSALGKAIDRAGYYGDGVKKPLGIKNLPGVNAVAFAAVQPTYEELVFMEGEIASDNADVSSMVYVSNTKFRSHCKTTQKFAGTNGAPIWEPGNQVNGYGAEITNRTANGDVFHGNFADALLGMWGGLDLTVDPYSNSKRGRVRIVAFQDVDIAYRHVESFCYGAKPSI